MNQRLKTDTTPATKIVNGTKNIIEEVNKAFENHFPNHRTMKHKKEKTVKNKINKKETFTTLSDSLTSLGKKIANSYFSVDTQVRIDDILTKR